MTLNDVTRQARQSRDIQIQNNPRTGLCVLTGIDNEGAFYIALESRTFQALKRHNLIVLASQGNIGPDIWFFTECV